MSSFSSRSISGGSTEPDACDMSASILGDVTAVGPCSIMHRLVCGLVEYSGESWALDQSLGQYPQSLVPSNAAFTCRRILEGAHSAPSQLHFKGFKGDDFLKHRA